MPLTGQSKKRYMKRYNREYSLQHEEQIKKSRQLPENKKQHANRQKKFRQRHPKLIKAFNHEYYQNHRVELIERWKKWVKNHPEKIKEFWKRRNYKRRGLGFIPLNKPFDGAVKHHIDFDHVLYIPRELHTSIPHNVWTGRNMEEINALALEYLVNVDKEQTLNTTDK